MPASGGVALVALIIPVCPCNKPCDLRRTWLVLLVQLVCRCCTVALLHCCCWSCTSRHRMNLIDTPTAACWAKSATAISSAAPTDTCILRILPRYSLCISLCVCVCVVCICKSIFFPHATDLVFGQGCLLACLPSRELSSRHFFWPTNYAEML